MRKEIGETECQKLYGCSRLWRTSEVAQMLGVSSRYVRRLTEMGRIPCIRMSSRTIRFIPHYVVNALNQVGYSRAKSLIQQEIPKLERTNA